MPLSKRVDMALAAERYNTAREKVRVFFGPLAMNMATCTHAIWRAVRYGDFSEPWCTCIPAYTGGENVAQRAVAVDGRLRTPQCFGGMGEPWAQPDDGADCGDTGDVMRRVVDLHPDRSSLRILSPIATAR